MKMIMMITQADYWVYKDDEDSYHCRNDDGTQGKEDQRPEEKGYCGNSTPALHHFSYIQYTLSNVIFAS